MSNSIQPHRTTRLAGSIFSQLHIGPAFEFERVAECKDAGVDIENRECLGNERAVQAAEVLRQYHGE